MKLYQLLILGFFCLFSFIKLSEVSGIDIETPENPNKRARIETESHAEAKCCICLQIDDCEHLTKTTCKHIYHPACLNQAFIDTSSNIVKCFECGTEITYECAFVSILRTKKLPEGLCCLRDKFGDQFVKWVIRRALKCEPVSVLLKLLKLRFPFNINSMGASIVEIAAYMGTPEKVEAIVRSGIPLGRSVEDVKKQVFVTALAAGNFANAEYAVSGGVNFKKLHFEGQSLLNYFIRSKKTSSIKWLIDNGIDVNIKKVQNDDYPIHYAISIDNNEALAMLLAAGANVEVLNDLKRTPLFSACYLGRSGAVKLLLEHGVDTQKFTFEGYNAFHYSIIPGHVEIAKYLIGRSFSIAMKDGTLCYVLHRVVYSGHFEMIKYLLEVGASPHEKFDAATYAITLNDFPCVNGRLAMFDPPIVVAILYNYRSIVQAFLEAGFNANKRIFNLSDDTSLLHLAFEMGHLEIARLLIQYGADVNSMDSLGRYAYTRLKAEHSVFFTDMDQYLLEN